MVFFALESRGLAPVSDWHKGFWCMPSRTELLRLCPTGTVYITRGLILDVDMWMRAKGSLQPRTVTPNISPSKDCPERVGAHPLTIHRDHLPTYIDRPLRQLTNEGSRAREAREGAVLQRSGEVEPSISPAQLTGDVDASRIYQRGARASRAPRTR